MGILQNIKNFFIGEEPIEEPPQLGMEAMSNFDALPVTFTNLPTATIDRQLGRLLNLYRVRNKTEDVLDSIEAYKAGIEKLGYNAPMDEQSTLDLIEVLKG